MSALPPKADIAESDWHVLLCQKHILRSSKKTPRHILYLHKRAKSGDRFAYD